LGTIQTGSPLPPITLPDQDRNAVDLSTFKGTKLLLSFHPLAWTGVCMRQMEALEFNVEVLAELGAQAFGISVDPVPTKKAWAESMNVEKTRLLSDFWPHGGAAQSLGLFREADGITERAAILVDAEGIVRFVKVYPIGDQPDLDELMEKLKAI